jgi:hypothetical protein
MSTPATDRKTHVPSEALRPDAVFMQMLTGAWVTQAIYAAARLGIADLVKDGPKTAGELARATRTHPPALARLVRALATLGVLSHDGERYGPTPLSALFESGPTTMRAMVLHMFEPPSWRAWGDLLHSIETGETAFVHANGSEVFPFYAANAESAAVFDEAMTNFSEAVAAAVAAAYDVAPFATIVDVGGGHGTLLATLLASAPASRGVLFDQPAVVEGAGEAFASRGVADRVAVASGDFFEGVPEGGDLYVLKHIIHDWEDERALRILGNVRDAAARGARLALVETVVPPSTEPSLAPLMDLHMMVMTGGCERTEAEFRTLLDRAGFDLERVVATDSPVSIVEARARG